jgi:cytochrome P450
MLASLLIRLGRLPKQLLGVNPFAGECTPGRVKLVHFGSKRPCFPFPHPWNFHQPIRILESYFWLAEQSADQLAGARHNRYLDVPGFHPILVSRDPAIIRAITTDTGDKPGQFDRDTLPSTGIARATGADTLLYSNGSTWKTQRKLAASPFGKTTLFQPELFQEFAETFRHTVSARIHLLRDYLQASGQRSIEIQLEPEIKAVMLEMLTNCFFGTQLSYDVLRNVYVPALERVIECIVRDTVTNKIGLPIWRWPGVTPRIRQARADYARFEELTSAVLAARRKGAGLWKQFKSDAPDEALRSNLKVFLAGALEATTSYATWAIAHLARDSAAQERVAAEVQHQEDYTPAVLEGATYLGRVLDETLRLTPSLYFLPRRATVDTWLECADGRKLFIPQGTHILLDVWHANRHEDFWGEAATGFPAEQFAPERWERLAALGKGSKEVLHFGFGHGPRVCPGKHLGQLEVALVVGAMVKMFRFTAPHHDYEVRAGVSTKPADGTLVRIELRDVVARG